MSLLPQRVAIPAHLLLHAQGGIEGPLGVILMRNWRPEQGKDAIAQRLSYIALIAMHGVHHELQGGVNDGAGFFGIEAFNESGRAFEISKEGSDGLALAVWCTTGFHGRLLGQDALGQMRRRVAHRARIWHPGSSV